MKDYYNPMAQLYNTLYNTMRENRCRERLNLFSCQHKNKYITVNNTLQGRSVGEAQEGNDEFEKRPKSSLDFNSDSMETVKAKELMKETMKESGEGAEFLSPPETKSREVKKALSRIPRSGKKNLHQPTMPSPPRIRYLGAPSY